MSQNKPFDRRKELIKYTKFLNNSGILGVILLDIEKTVTAYFWAELEKKDIKDINEGENF